MMPDDARSSSAGFGVVEVLISAATFAIVAFVLVGLIHEYSLTAQTLTTKQHSHLDVARLLDAWQTDSSSADAVFIPDVDVFGSDNTAGPHEVDFYTK
ncbi:MAG: hypothetical protein M3126_10870, partial [Candidatus Eremiobacteraeota bacterium]|nr:hypothetical protein [Candidatus Eremiobacteraeota bacterium]